MPGTEGQDKVTIREAAERLSVTPEAIRKRIQRGTIEHEKAPDGRVYVYLDKSKDVYRPPKPRATPDALAKVLRDQVEYLREVIRQRDRELEARTEELRRKDHIIAALTERIPELEAPREATESPESASEGQERGTRSEPETGTQRRSWWHRFWPR